jgi:hypothetical protein
VSGFEIKATLKGEAELRAKVARWAKDFPGAMGAALYTAGDDLRNRARSLAPVQSGQLRAGAYVKPPELRGGQLGVEVGFGQPYATYQHELTRLRHPQGGEAKYLQRALRQVQPGLLSYLANQVKQNVIDGVSSTVTRGPTNPNHARPLSRFRRILRRRR